MSVVWQDHAKIELKEAVQYYRANAGNDVTHDFRDEVRRLTRQLPRTSGRVSIVKFAVTHCMAIPSISFIA
ncbi:MAG: hypothetical protein WAV22_11010 [Porticoccaceae bacterium]